MKTQMTRMDKRVLENLLSLVRCNQTNRKLKGDDFVLREFKPTDVILPDSPYSRFRKNGNCDETKRQIMPFWDDRYKHIFRLSALHGIDGARGVRSRKHEIWIGNFFPNFILNEAFIERLEYTVKPLLLEEISKDKTLGVSAKIVAIRLMDIFVLTLYNTLTFYGGVGWWKND